MRRRGCAVALVRRARCPTRVPDKGCPTTGARPGIAVRGSKRAVNAALPVGSGQALGACGWPHQSRDHTVTAATGWGGRRVASLRSRILARTAWRCWGRCRHRACQCSLPMGCWHLLYPPHATFQIARLGANAGLGAWRTCLVKRAAHAACIVGLQAFCAQRRHAVVAIGRSSSRVVEIG